MERSNQWSRGGVPVDTSKTNKIRVLRIKKDMVNIQIGWNLNQSNREYSTILKKHNGQYDVTSRGFAISVEKLDKVLDELRNMLKVDNLEASLEPVPEYVNKYVSDIQMPLTFKIIRNDRNIKENIRMIYNTQKDLGRSVDNLDLEFREKMYAFQRESITFGISKYGRLLIGDEMGVGKTIQALGLCGVYSDEWPFLVIAPSSLRFNWKKEATAWLRFFLKDDIDPLQIVWKKSDGISKLARGVIISYDLAKMMGDEIEERQFRVIVCDEAHYLKSVESVRTSKLIPILQKAKRLVLLTGTPALARPIELYPLLSAIRPDAFPFHDIKEYGLRYCAPEFNRHSKRLEYKGCDNAEELNFVLSHLMIRRLKRDVLAELPSKIRQVYDIKGSASEVKEIKDMMKKIEKETGKDLNQILEQRITGEIGQGGSKGAGGGGDSFANMLSVTSKIYEITARAKIAGVTEFLRDLSESNIKIIIFAHHVCMIDALEEFAKEELAKKKKKYIKIDGRTQPNLRGQLAEQFQNDPHCYYAILSITAASTGFTLTKASTVVFAELNWTPANLEQAEARAHRIGQESCVTVYYLLAKDTIDQSMFELIKKKSDTTGKILDGENAQSFTYQESKKNNSTLDNFFGVKDSIQSLGTFKDGVSKLCGKVSNLSIEQLGPTSFSGLLDRIKSKPSILSRPSAVTEEELKELEELEAEVFDFESKPLAKVKIPTPEERSHPPAPLLNTPPVLSYKKEQSKIKPIFDKLQIVKLSKEEVSGLDVEGELDDILSMDDADDRH